MPEYLAPGVYVEEIEIGAKPIEGVSTSTAAFVGIAQKGPMNDPTLITGWEQFRRRFGDYMKESYLAYAVYGFFSNGGKRCYVVRVADTDAVSNAYNIFKDGNNADVIKILASSPGAWGKNITAEIVQSSLGSTFLYASKLDEDIASTQNYFVPKSVKGISIGDKVRICDRKGRCSTSLTIQSFDKANGKTKVMLSTSVGGDFFAENSVAMAVIESGTGTNSATLVSARGFDKGSLIGILQASKDSLYAGLKEVKLSENRIFWDGKFKDKEGNEASEQTAYGAQLVDIKRVSLSFRIQTNSLAGGSSSIQLGDIQEIVAGTKILIRPGDKLTFGTGVTSETVTVDHDWDGTTPLEFSPPVQNTHPVGTTFTALTAPQATLFSAPKADVVRETPSKFKFKVTGFKAGDFLSFVDSNDTEIVQKEIASIDSADPTKVTLKTALTNNQWNQVATVEAVLKQNQKGIVVSTTVDFKAGELVEVTSDTTTMLLMLLREADGNRLVFEDNPPWPADTDSASFVAKKWEKTEVKTLEFKITATYEKGKEKVAEEFDKLSLDPESARYFKKEGVIKKVSTLIDVEDTRPTPSTPAGIQELPTSDKKPLNQGGDDGIKSIKATDYIGAVENGERTGIMALEPVDEVNILCVPDIMMSFGGGNGTLSPDDVELVQLAMISHCERMKDRFAILDSLRGYTVQEIQTWRKDNLDSKYAALYYPWIKVRDPIGAENGKTRLVPPSGHIAGIYARSDTERGVHKAPANEIVRDVIELERKITKGEQEILNPDGIDCIRPFPGRGIRVWGARTISSDALWKYINVRRLFLFLEESIEEGTQWVVFEPNDEKLWARVKQTITQFLTRVWKDGALMGSTPEEAFFVKCDRTTMTQDDIDNGRLIVLIGVAPVKPAEFVIFRIAQWQGGSEISE